MQLQKIVLTLSLSILFNLLGNAQSIKIKYVNAFENINHPEVAYWFFTDKMMAENRFKGKIDSFAKLSKYTLIFLTERDGCDFYDAKTMHPIFQKLVAYAHTKGLKIALQLWKSDKGTLLENTDRLMQEGEVMLDENGKANYRVNAKGARDMTTLIKSELFKIYAFKKTTEGFYALSTLKEITNLATAETSKAQVNISISAGNNLKGYTAYILTQHYYSSCSNFSDQAKSILLNGFEAYADIPFDGIGLDEYKNMKIARQKVMDSTNDTFRERVYSLAMAKKMKETAGMDLDKTLFDMRYAPAGNPSIRIKAINTYMGFLRTETLDIETAMYNLGKKMYGKDAFIGLHNTFHNNLDHDEVWQTGVSWWSIKRDYGHTDENIATAIQMGVGMCYKQRAMYNMYYDKSLEKIWTKALYDLRFGVRTHYHAANDVDGWGVSIDDPIALEKINKVENAARLLNRFNPPLPHIKLLVVYGMEALFNWYPTANQRGMYDVNDKLAMDKKSQELWDNGYLNASVPTDVIVDGRLKVNNQGKATLNGHIFDAIVLLNPQYAKESTSNFFKNYINKGGKLLVEGKATYDFEGKDMFNTWKYIIAKSVANSYSINNVAKLGIPKNDLVDGVENEAGSFTFTNIESLKTNKPASFSFTYKGNTFKGDYRGLAAVKIDVKGNLEKLAATGFSTLSKNGKPVITLNAEADVFADIKNGMMEMTIADETKSITCTKR